jgi:S-adenosylmethionine-diacylglycerol 3-amino-3-carboxypropyl transferase
LQLSLLVISAALTPNTGTRYKAVRDKRDDIQMRAEFDFVRYANCWEDARILIEALKPSSGKRILSVASAGDNSLSLLARGAEVVAVDISTAQLACLELRKTAIARLDYEDCLAFLGVGSQSDRLSVYRQLRSELTMSTRSFWDAHSEAITKGIIHSGKFERYFQLFRRWVLPCIHSRDRITTLLSQRPREQRFDFYNNCWANRRWHWLFRLFFSRAAMARMGRDPEFFRYVEGAVADRLIERTRYALTELDTSDNPYLTYILTGNFGPALPDYLRPEVFCNLRSNLSGLKIILGGVEDAVTHFKAFDGFNLSDIFEYVSVETMSAIYGQLLEHAEPGARLAYWNMMVPRTCPLQYRQRINSLDTLASALFKQDRAFFYSRFVIEEIL